MEQRVLRRKAIESYLRYAYLGGGMTFTDDTVKLPPKPVFSVKEGRTREEYRRELDHILDSMLAEEREHSDSAFLSSGVDSSLLAFGIKAKKTFSVVYDDPDFDESVYARKNAAMIGSEHHEVKIGPADYFGTVSEALKMRGLPTGDASYIALYIAARETAKYTDTVCSGEGPDEMFCGYHCYRKYLETRDPDLWLKLNIILGTDDEELRELYKEYEDPFLKMNAFDHSWWMYGNILPNVEKAAEAAGIDIRTPYMRRDLMDFALSLPREYKVNPNEGKVLFRESAERYVGKETAHMEKKGFPVPVRKWMKSEPWKTQILDTMYDSRTAEILGIEDPGEIAAVFYEKGDDTIWKRIWEMFAFMKWYDATGEL